MPERAVTEASYASYGVVYPLIGHLTIRAFRVLSYISQSAAAGSTGACRPLPTALMHLRWPKLDHLLAAEHFPMFEQRHRLILHQLFTTDPLQALHPVAP